MPEPSHVYPGINVGLKHSAWRSNGNWVPAYEVCGGEIERLLPVREVFMMTLMDRLTDKPDWNKKVFDEDIVSKWRKEALEQSEKKLFEDIVNWSSSSGDRLDEPSAGTLEMRGTPFPQRHRIMSEYAFDYVCQDPCLKASPPFEIPDSDSLSSASAS